MNRRYAGTLLGALILGSGLIARGQSVVDSGGFTELQRAAIADSGNSETIMGLIERESESRTPKHFHPGGEFGFVLEGELSVESEGKPNTVLRAGESFYQPAGEWHIISTSAAGARTIVFRVVQKGQPMVVMVE